MSLPLTYAGGSAEGISAALDLKFASTLSLTSSSGITPSFSRASSGTYFGSDGVLKYANVNTILYSEDFTNAYWVKSGISVSGNSTVSPDGKITADKIVENSAGGIKYGTISGGFSVTSGTTYCFSVYLKDSGRYLGFATNSTAFPNAIGAVFNPTNGTISNIQPNTTASMQDFGNGWYRCSISGTANATTTTNINFGVSNDLNQIYPSYTGNGSSGYFLWGFQMETGSTPGTYVPTTNAANSAPRFDHTYNGTSWISRGLLVEEQRTNSAQYSEDLTNAYWTKLQVSISSNNANAPDGNTTADKVVENTANAQHTFYNSGFSVTAGTAYTISFFAKAAGRNFIQFRPADTLSGPNSQANFNLSNGTLGTVVGTNHTCEIIDCGNGWYRCVSRFSSASSTGTAFLQFTLIDSATATPGQAYLGDGTSGVLVWGIQLEAGSAFATSYIPSLSNSSTTRSADVCQITGTNFSSFWNGTEGSVAVEYDYQGTVFSGPLRFAEASQGNQSVSIQTSSGNLYAEVYSSTNGGTQASFSASPLTGVNKTALAFAANNFAASFNGATVQTDTSGAMPTGVVIAYIGSPGGAAMNGHIARLRYFNKRLTDKQLEDLCRPEDQLKLDLKFSDNLSLTPVVGPTPSFSRASTGTYFNSSGVLTSAAINAPRFDHTFDGTSWISKGLLIEEQRTNTCLYSSNIGNAYWSGTSSKTANFGISPDGTQNAARITGGGYFQSGGISKTGTQTFSFWAKTISGNSENIDVYLDGGFTTTSKTITGSWVRYSVTQTFGSTDTGTIGIYPLSANILFYGPQLESGAFSTSYIPTTTTSVVRSADVCQITGSNFSGMWNASEGSAAIEWDSINGSSGDNYILTAYQSGLSSSINFYASSTNAEMYTYNSGYQARFLTAKPSALTAMKMAYGYRANDFAGSFNGAAVLTDTSGSVAGATSLQIGQYDGTGTYLLNGHISRIRYYAIRLPNRLLIAKSQ